MTAKKITRVPVKGLYVRVLPPSRGLPAASGESCTQQYSCGPPSRVLHSTLQEELGHDDLVRPNPLRKYRGCQPHRDGTADAKPRRPGTSAHPADGYLLRAARHRRADRLRGHTDLARRPGLPRYAGYLQLRAKGRLAPRDRRGARQRRRNRTAVVACGAYIACFVATERAA